MSSTAPAIIGTMSPPVIRIRALNATYGIIRALVDVSCEIPRAGVHGILGPNGAGKSTLIHMIVGLARPKSGVIERDGEAAGGQFRIGYQPEEPALYDYLTVDEFLELAATIAGTASDKAEISRVVSLFELEPGVQARKLSAGSRRKLSIAAALVQKPRVLVLDEPTNGLDARAVVRLKDELVRLRNAGTAVVLSTHIFDFASAVCDSVTLLTRGRVAFDGLVASLPGYSGPASFERIVARLVEL